jgi:hypothetical protein
MDENVLIFDCNPGFKHPFRGKTHFHTHTFTPTPILTDFQHDLDPDFETSHNDQKLENLEAFFEPSLIPAHHVTRARNFRVQAGAAFVIYIA